MGALTPVPILWVESGRVKNWVEVIIFYSVPTPVPSLWMGDGPLLLDDQAKLLELLDCKDKVLVDKSKVEDIDLYDQVWFVAVTEASCDIAVPEETHMSALVRITAMNSIHLCKVAEVL